MNNQLPAQIESILFYKQAPLTLKALERLCGSNTEAVQTAIATLKEDLEGRGVSLIEANDTVQLVTDSSFSELIAEIKEKEVDTNLTNAQSEALAVIAYLAPVQKPTIDFIRGVNSRAVLRNLSTRGLITKARSGGKDFFELTTDALAHLGVTDKESLPDYKDTREKLQDFVNSDAVAAEEGAATADHTIST